MLDNPVVPLAIYDVIRIVTMQVVTQLSFTMMYDNIPFFNPVFVQTVIFLVLGSLIFWLFLYKHITMKLGKKHIKDTNEE